MFLLLIKTLPENHQLTFGFSRKVAKFPKFAYATKQAHFNPLPDDKILDWSKLKQIADNILKCK